VSDDVPAFAPRRPRIPVTATGLLVVANVAVFLFMWRQGVHPTEPDPESLVRWGAIDRELVRHGEWWRLATAMFVHVGWMHAAVNMFSLSQVGPLVERLFGRGPFLALYLLSGLFASLASVLAHADGVSAGASGAIFGIVGGLVAFLLRVGRRVFPRRAVRGLLLNLAIVIALNVGIGFVVPMIDNAAHLGGLASGGVLGAALAGAPTRKALVARNHRAGVVTVVALVTLAAGVVLLVR